MTSLMPQPGLGLTAPSSRQDIISALLNDYGNSFGGETSPYNYSPGLSKELPPPPSGDEKPLPPIMMRFQLRVDEPRSPASPFADPSPIEPPTKIISRSMSRNSKPRSLKLSKSNGSTALVPASPAPPAPAKDDVYSPPVIVVDERPPPPPPKSERRKSSMSTVAPKQERRDSKEPQAEEPLPPIPPVKRKPVPVAKGFVSLADLGSGPRGRKPVPSREGSRRPSVARSDNESPARKALDGIRPTVSMTEVPKVEKAQKAAPTISLTEAPRVVEKPVQKEEAPLPPPPRKAMGLPSNPRARSQESKHTRGKSSTGLDLMKATKTISKGSAPTPALATIPSPVQAKQAPAPSPAIGVIPARVPAPVLSSITPGPTPSPRKTEAIQTGAAVQGPTLASTIQAALLQSPISPISVDSDGRRPFSFEGIRKQQQQQQQQPPQQQPTNRPIAPPKEPDSPVSSPFSLASFPPRTTSRPTASQSTTQTSRTLTPSPPPSIQTSISTSNAKPNLDNPATLFPLGPPSPSSFIPLTKAPNPIPALPITTKHLHCYTSHATFSRYMARFQPPGCMVCYKTDPGARATCSCCYLLLCGECDKGLHERVRGRDLGALVELKKGERGDREDFS